MFCFFARAPPFHPHGTTSTPPGRHGAKIWHHHHRLWSLRLGALGKCSRGKKLCPVGLKLTRTAPPPSPLPASPSSTPPPGGSARASPLQKTCSARLEAIYHLLEPEITSLTFSPKHNATFNCQVRLKHVSFMRPISATSSPAQPHTPPSLNHDLSPRLVAKTCLRRQPRGLVAATTVVVSRWAPPRFRPVVPTPGIS